MHLRIIVIVLGIVAGIIVGHYSSYGSEAAIASLLLFVLQATLYVMRYRRVIKKTLHLTFFTLLFSLSFFIGVVRMQFVVTLPSFVCGQSCTFGGRIVAPPEVKDVYQVFDVKVVGEDTLHVRVRAPLYPEYEVGDILTLSGSVKVPSVLFPHGEKKTFDYSSYLRIKNVGSELYYPKIEKFEIENIKTFREQLMLFKKKIITKINSYISSPASSLASGMLLGNSEMSKELTETFRVAGLSHIVVLSGFNIAIMISLLLFLFKIFPLILRIVVVSSIVCMFVLMVGGEASVLRATLMSFIALLALLLGRGYVGEQALLVSFLVIILYSPLALIYDVSLHLSFLATAGIIYLSGGLKNYFLTKGISRYSEILSTSLSAYLATLPYIMYIFGTVSVYAVIANLLVLPFVPVIMLMTFIIVLLSFVSTYASSYLGYVTSIINDLVIWVARVTESLPYASLPVRVPASFVFILYLLMILVYLFLKTRRKNETQLTKNDELVSSVISY